MVTLTLGSYLEIMDIKRHKVSRALLNISRCKIWGKRQIVTIGGWAWHNLLILAGILGAVGLGRGQDLAVGNSQC